MLHGPVELHEESIFSCKIFTVIQCWMQNDSENGWSVEKIFKWKVITGIKNHSKNFKWENLNQNKTDQVFSIILPLMPLTTKVTAHKTVLKG